jgi:hypothetical protein
LSIGNIFKDYILAQKTTATIITDFKASFTEFAAYGSPLLERYIDDTFYLVPAYFINLGFDMSYKVYLYAVAHLLVSLGVQADGSVNNADDRITASMSAGGVSVSYKGLGDKGTMTEYEYFFGTTSYGKMILLFLKNAGFGSSRGGYVI